MGTRLLTIGGVARERPASTSKPSAITSAAGCLRCRRCPLGGTRHYGEAVVKRIRFIKRAQGLGFSLNEIAGLLDVADGRSCSAACGAAERKLWEIERRIGRSSHDARGAQPVSPRLSH